jgi:ricin-type beta-trefoil lectin protein/putative serine esterase DUF676
VHSNDARPERGRRRWPWMLAAVALVVATGTTAAVTHIRPDDPAAVAPAAADAPVADDPAAFRPEPPGEEPPADPGEPPADEDGTDHVSKDEPVLFVHGISPGLASDCQRVYGAMVDELRANAFTGPFTTVGYYGRDTNCDVNLSGTSRSEAAGTVTVTDGMPFPSVGRALAWYIYDNFTSQGRNVQVVAYSQGGLITRSALQRAGTTPGYPPALQVSDVVTMGTPHLGSDVILNQLCAGVMGRADCRAMLRGSPQITELNRDCDPQGRDGTAWWNIASHSDAVVAVDSATGMCLAATRQMVFQGPTHTGATDYMHQFAVQQVVAFALGEPPAMIRSELDGEWCIDDQEGRVDDGNPIRTWECNGSDAQMWMYNSTGIEDPDDVGVVTLLAVQGKCLDVPRADAVAGQVLQLWECQTDAADGDGQRWLLFPGDGTIHPALDPSLCVDVPFGLSLVRPPLQLWPCNGGANQQWSY